MILGSARWPLMTVAVSSGSALRHFLYLSFGDLFVARNVPQRDPADQQYRGGDHGRVLGRAKHHSMPASIHAPMHASHLHRGQPLLARLAQQIRQLTQGG